MTEYRVSSIFIKAYCLVMTRATYFFVSLFILLAQVSEDIHIRISEQYCEADQRSVGAFVDHFTWEG